ncbi:MAG TPA: winged helix-turn-helix transcriptional regulator [Nitrosopumilaceae archaeon]|nr:winged helix-turn-helix transcriptional regulator [Nitrosopumilaceae archaeon]
MDRSSQVIGVIEKNPGIKFREIMRLTGMKNGVLSYYARKLEEKGFITVERSSRLTRFYPLGVDKKESVLMANLRQETPKNILLALLSKDSLTFNEIVVKVKRSQSTVSLYLTQLVQDGVVESKYINLKRIFKVTDSELVQKTINRYHPNLLESSADHLADIFTSL